MKKQISITLDEKIWSKAKEKQNEGLFRNTSHIIEYALKKFLESEG